MAWSLAFIGVYAILVGVASLIEVPAGQGLSAFQLNFLIRIGSLAAALIAAFALRGPAAPSAAFVVAGLGIGVVTGGGSILYCFALQSMSVPLVVTLSNLYLVITAALGIVVLAEPLTIVKVLGFAATLAGVVVLSHAPSRYGVSHSSAPTNAGPSKRAYLIMAAYVVVVGVGAFLEKPALRGLDATALNALMSVAMASVAGVALAAGGHRLPNRRRSLAAVGVGAMIGTGAVFYFLGLRGLPVSVAASASNASIVVTVLLSAVTQHQPLGWDRGAAVLTTLVGVTMLAL